MLVDLFDPDAADEPEDLMAPVRAAADAVLEERGSVLLVIRVRRGSGMPGDEKRAAMSRWVRSHSEKADAEGIVWIEGVGFWAGAFRGVLSGVMFATGRRRVVGVVASRDELVSRVAATRPLHDGVLREFYDVPHPRDAEGSA